MASEWQRLFTSVQRALPKSASFHERGQATKRAAAEYRARNRGGGRSRRSNPRANIMPWLILAGAGYVGYKVFFEPKATAAAKP